MKFVVLLANSLVNVGDYFYQQQTVTLVYAGAIIGDGDRKSWDPRAPMISDNFFFLFYN